jgi:hypothetical protein
VLDGHACGVIRERVNQHRHVELGPAKRVGDCVLIAEVRQRHQHAVDAIGVLAKQVGTGARVGKAFDGAMWVASGASAMAPIPPFSNVSRIAVRPDEHRCDGKKPRLPTMTPSVVEVD